MTDAQATALQAMRAALAPALARAEAEAGVTRDRLAMAWTFRSMLVG